MTRWLSLICALVLAGCVRPAEERAERDLEIGEATIGTTSVRVSGGLAAIRRGTPGEIELWQSAPAIDIHFQRPKDAPSQWTVRIKNTTPDLLARASGAGKSLSLTQSAGSVRTQATLSVNLPVGESTLSLAPADAADSGSFRFAVLSDVQEAIDDVQDIYRKMNAEPGLRFVLGAGDLTQQGTVSQLTRFEEELRVLELPYYTTLGNHELGAGPPPFQDLYGRANFSFEFKAVRFSMLDSASATIDPLVYGWLDDWLADGRDQTHIVAMHIPPLDPIGVRNGAFASRAEAAKLLSRLAKGRVDLTLYGHIHSYYDFDNAGIPAHISGGGGAIPERFDGIGRHFLVVEADGAVGVKGVRVVRVD